jgi:hypothetical protein
LNKIEKEERIDKNRKYFKVSGAFSLESSCVTEGNLGLSLIELAFFLENPMRVKISSCQFC